LVSFNLQFLYGTTSEAFLSGLFMWRSSQRIAASGIAGGPQGQNQTETDVTFVA